jgi:Flp pilus assembly protein TadB
MTPTKPTAGLHEPLARMSNEALLFGLIAIPVGAALMSPSIGGVLFIAEGIVALLIASDFSKKANDTKQGAGP